MTPERFFSKKSFQYPTITIFITYKKEQRNTIIHCYAATTCVVYTFITCYYTSLHHFSFAAYEKPVPGILATAFVQQGTTVYFFL